MSTSTLSRKTAGVKRNSGGARSNDEARQSVKVTFALPAPLAQKLREAVEKGAAPSQNALVREALARELKRVREAEIERAYAEAAADPLYMQDLEECMKDFAELDRDALQYLDAEPQYEEVGA